jgi:hypothetical protein
VLLALATLRAWLDLRTQRPMNFLAGFEGNWMCGCVPNRCLTLRQNGHSISFRAGSAKCDFEARSDCCASMVYLPLAGFFACVTYFLDSLCIVANLGMCALCTNKGWDCNVIGK